MTADGTISLARCTCGEYLWTTGALQVWVSGVLHRPESPCIETDDLAAFTLCACGDPIHEGTACP